jgi:hypothetical protein
MGEGSQAAHAATAAALDALQGDRGRLVAAAAPGGSLRSTQPPALSFVPKSVVAPVAGLSQPG